jgi:DNA repair photolyase
MSKISGTKEWSVASLNFHQGCEHRCRDCYARHMAVRFHRCSLEDWGRTYNQPKDEPFDGFRRKYPGRVMLPTTHDLPPALLPQLRIALDVLLEKDNQILLVTKPHLETIWNICEQYQGWRENIYWRFTIGAMDDRILSYWEPGAPDFTQRYRSLRTAWVAGFSTSVSIEPMLDSARIEQLVKALLPYVTDTIWIGKMNKIKLRVPADTDPAEIARIEAGQTDARIREIYLALKDHPKIRWKESVKEVVGLPLAEQPGQDI